MRRILTICNKLSLSQVEFYSLSVLQWNYPGYVKNNLCLLKAKNSYLTTLLVDNL